MNIQSVFSNLKKVSIALPVIAASLTFNTGFAEAASLEGSFQISNLFTTIDLSKENGIDFMNDVTDPLAEVGLAGQTGDFDDFNSAFISDFSDLTAGNVEVNSFLDLSAASPSFPNDEVNLADGISLFNVTHSSGLLVTQQANGLLSLSLELDGMFISETGDESQGQSILTFQIAEAGITVDDFWTRYDSGEVFEGITFSGAAFATKQEVPEHASLLGLAAIVGIAGTVIRKRKE
ncbi:MAG: hypothetical protein AAGA60_21700 [Cyanobacteria bacterium P01_E01_bin.42]